MMENSTLPENSIAVTGNREDGEARDGFGEDPTVKVEEGDRNLCGNRWPRQETLALLQIRSDMDGAFRDSGHKAPLWEEVSRKLSELGYNRSAKKCKEKFENIYKYHRRTKGCRSARPNSKTYRFFEQLEALDSHHTLLPPPSPANTQTNMAAPIKTANANVIQDAIPCSIPNPTSNCFDTSTSTSSSSKESDRTCKKKRKLSDFFERLMREVMEKQEKLQKKFIEAIEKCEQDRIEREEAWKMQELARIKRERELLVQERSVAAAKDAAVLAFLQKFSEQANLIQVPQVAIPIEKAVERQENGNGGESFIHMSSSRWPKEEIEALIRLRTNLDSQYEENGPKGPLWEEVSAAMKKLGYDRSAKRCKEKWENMNKYFKKVRESNKKRPGDSKTCPYFEQLDALYKGKTRKVDSLVNSGYDLKPEELLMHMMGTQEEQRQPESLTEDAESENVDQSQEHGNNEDGGIDYQSVADNPSSLAIIG